jgi:hypothetical protein
LTSPLPAGTRITAARVNVPASVQSEIAGQGSTTSTTYTGTLTGTGGVSQVFTAPPSGRVNVAIQCGIVNTTLAGEGWVSVEARTGSVIGSGSVVSGYGAADIHALRAKAASTGNDVQFGTSCLVTGLTPGAVYHVRQMYRIGTSGGGTAFYTNKIINVIPAP